MSDLSPHVRGLITVTQINRPQLSESDAEAWARRLSRKGEQVIAWAKEHPAQVAEWQAKIEKGEQQ
ncbi:MAG: hypothetical protein II875_00990 [Clostridia bacterium]|nr:hypothetical protein [Clostridia bacterium]